MLLIKKITRLPILSFILFSLSAKAQHSLPSTIVNGDLKVTERFNVNDRYLIKTLPGSLASMHPQVVVFSSKPTGGKGDTWNEGDDCAPFGYRLVGPPGTQSMSLMVAFNNIADVIRISGSLPSNSQPKLDMGVLDDDGIIAVQSPNAGKLRLNPGCRSDVYICEGGGSTKMFGDASVESNLRVGGGTFNSTNITMLSVNATNNFSSAFKI